ncbi:phospholipase A2 inhibitor gamma subunit B-like [Anomaloglossus baeobatrachus]|uniref:phospholipase A2 inhibitor gamma subunit B-like n=1 Tax=Anomaloglossus baeobatrachus TaxID=238106 RepID=UPI003F500A3A
MTVCQYFHSGEKDYNSIYKGCANETLCASKGAEMMETIRFRFNAICCTGELCNTAQYEFAEEDPTPNGVMCPTAHCNDTLDECKTDKTITCTGSMDKCVEYRGKVHNPDGSVELYSAKGCANSDCCKYNFDTNIGIEKIHKVLVKC